MDRVSLIISGFTKRIAEQFGGVASQILRDRLELIALELREAKIRFFQAMLLICMGMFFFMQGCLLLVLASLYAAPPEWRIYGLVLVAIISLLAGTALFMVLRNHLKRKPLAFDQSLAELKKDMTCFSTKS